MGKMHSRSSGARRLALLGPRQVNAALGVLMVTVLGTGLASWFLSDSANGLATTLHAVAGIMIVLLLPSKVLGPVRSGLRRSSYTRWLSVLFGVAVLATLLLGIVHAAGVSYGVGEWSPLWTHQLLGFASLLLGLVHVVNRPSKPNIDDLDRRNLMRLGAVAMGASILRLAHSPVQRLVGTSEWRATGSYEIGSYQPTKMPTVFWINDRPPDDTAPGNWPLTIQGTAIEVESLWAQTVTIDAVLDCTGGWWSAQRWNAIALSDLVHEPTGRSLMIESATGYKRWYRLDELDNVYLAVGYDGKPLQRGHGAPVRLIVPGRRGPEWIKWVTKVADSDRPAWLTSPLPLS